MFMWLLAIRISLLLLATACLTHGQLTLRDTPFLAKRFGGGIPGPESIPNLWQWFKPETLVSSNNGDLVGLWLDSSGNNWPATQAIATNRPYYTNIALGGLGGLYFDGELDNFTLVNPGVWSNMFRNVPGGTLIAVHSRQAMSGEFVVVWISQGDIGPIQRAALSRGPTTANPQLIATGSRLDAEAQEAVIVTGALTNTWYYMLGDFVYSDADLFLYTNNALAGSNTDFRTPGNTSDTPSLLATMGYYVVNQTFKGWIAEVIIYSRSLTAAEKATLNTYMTNKYGAYSTW